jgi:DNA invertase Pin-like site-specific DNA recombinase
MELERLNIRFIAITQGIDTGDDSVMGKLTRNIIMAFAEFERGMIQERVIAGIESARRRGVKFGRKEVPLNDMAWGFIKMAARGEISNHAATKEINALGIGLSRTSIIRKVRAEKEKLECLKNNR